MQTRSYRTGDGQTRTYYRAGEGVGAVVFCVGAPGMSSGFWFPVVGELQSEHTCIIFDCRRFRAGEGASADGELRWGDLVEDMSLILGQESASAAHLVSWGLGTKLALAFCEARPGAALSLTAFAVSDTALEADRHDVYTDAVSALGRSLEARPQSVDLLTALLKRVGGHAGPNLLASALSGGEEVGAVLRLIDLLEMESPMANLAFEGLETPAGLLSYLKVNGAFLRAGVIDDLQSLNLPITVVEASEDGLVSLSAENRRRLSAVPGLTFQTISPATHFVLLERPLRAARVIARGIGQEHPDRSARPRHVSPLITYA